VRFVFWSTRIVNHPGVSGSKNDTFHAGRPLTRTVPSTCASTAFTQNGCGCVTGVWGLVIHFDEPAGFVQRLSPITIERSPVFTASSSRSGATIVQIVWRVTLPSPSRSRITIVCSFSHDRRAWATIPAPLRGGQAFGRANVAEAGSCPARVTVTERGFATAALAR